MEGILKKRKEKINMLKLINEWLYIINNNENIHYKFGFVNNLGERKKLKCIFDRLLEGIRVLDSFEHLVYYRIIERSQGLIIRCEKYVSSFKYLKLSFPKEKQQCCCIL